MRCRRCEATGLGVASALTGAVLLASMELHLPDPGGGGSGGQSVTTKMALFQGGTPAQTTAPANEAEAVAPASVQAQSVDAPSQSTSVPESQAIAPQDPVSTAKAQAVTPEERSAQRVKHPVAQSHPQEASESSSANPPSEPIETPTQAQASPTEAPKATQKKTQTSTSEASDSTHPAQRSGGERAAGSPAQAPAAGAGLTPSYKAALRAAIEANKHYPRRARMRRQEGRVTVAFTLHANGRISNVRVVDGAPTPSLNRAAQEAVAQVGRFRPLPKEIGSERMEIRLAMRFSTR